MRTFPCAVLTAFLVLGSFPAVATAESADWPGWRGANRDGRSPETGLLQEWPEGGPPRVLHATGLGLGYSSLAVVGERIYTLGDIKAGQHAFALDRKSGALVWQRRLGNFHVDQFPGPRSTPSVDGGQLFAMTSDGDLHALDAATGEPLWKRSLPQDFGGFLMQARDGFDWRFTESPLVDGDHVVVTPGTREAALVALDRETGEVVWKTVLPEDMGPEGLDGAGYASAVLSEAGGVRQVVQFLGRGLVGVDAATGEILWRYNRIANHVANIPTPLVDGDRVFAATGYSSGGAVGLRLTKGEGGFDVRELFFHEGRRLQNHHGQMVLHEGHVYIGHGLNRGLPTCVELETGNLVWGPARNLGMNSVAISYADGHLYLRYQDGLVLLVEATSEDYREKGSLRIPNVRHPSWSHPVIAGGRLYLRELDELHVYDVRDRKRAKQEEKDERKAVKAARKGQDG